MMETDKISDHFMISYNSLVEITLTTDCFSLSGLSLDHKGIPLASVDLYNENNCWNYTATAQGARPCDRHDCIAAGFDFGAGVKESYERSYYEIY